jgi:hypothetical protein
MKNIFLIVITILYSQYVIAQPSELMIHVTADVQTSASGIILRWDAVPDTGDLYIYRKTANALVWGNKIATLPANSITYTDNNVTKDSVYEYQVIKNVIPNLININPSGYIYASIERAPKHNRGTFLILVDSTFSSSCSQEIDQLTEDVNADGWKVLRKDFNRQAKDTAIKNYILNEYNKDNTLNTVFILGHIAIPYSGNVWPDSHPEHKGAWPADVYYADLNGLWTDNTVDDTFSTRPENDNIPGDGKWDQSEVPTPVELAIGRVDFYDMPLFAKTEVAMMKSYLNKNHNYKIAAIPTIHRALIDDNFINAHPLFAQETLADNGWLNFSVMLGIDSVKNLDLVSTLNTQNYQWAYGCGYGTYSSCQGIGSTSTFTTNAVNSIFVLLFGSYYGNWDTKNNFLRAPLCSDVPALATCWAGRPKWYFHHMAMGETIGFSTMVTQNNKSIIPGKAITYNPAGYYAGEIHAALMGDPGLRLDYLQTPTTVKATRIKNKTSISWTPSPDPAVIGYYVYSSNDSLGKYDVKSPIVNGNGYTDTGNADKYYMVRAVKKQTNPSGAYINLSLGSKATVTVLADTAVNITLTNITPSFQLFPNPAEDIIHLNIENTQGGLTHVTITTATGVIVKQMNTTSANNDIDIRELTPGIYFMKLIHGNYAGQFNIVKL